MKAKERRAAIREFLLAATESVNATQLAEKFSVSRQIIVGDIALLRAEGTEIISTPRGYLAKAVMEQSQHSFIGRVACQHDQSRLAQELYIVVDNGAELVDVEVEHPLYGRISGELHIRSRYEAEEFIRKVETGEMTMLAALTDGVHLHTLACPDQITFQRIVKQLAEAGILYQEVELS